MIANCWCASPGHYEEIGVSGWPCKHGQCQWDIHQFSSVNSGDSNNWHDDKIHIFLQITKDNLGGWVRVTKTSLIDSQCSHQKENSVIVQPGPFLEDNNTHFHCGYKCTTLSLIKSTKKHVKLSHFFGKMWQVIFWGRSQNACVCLHITNYIQTYLKDLIKGLNSISNMT